MINPSIVFSGLQDCDLLPSSLHEQRRGNVFGGTLLEPVGMPKTSFISFSNRHYS